MANREKGRVKEIVSVETSLIGSLTEPIAAIYKAVIDHVPAYKVKTSTIVEVKQNSNSIDVTIEY